MILKKSLLISFGILVMVLVITAGCISQPETSVVKASGNTQQPTVAPNQAALNTGSDVTSTSNTGSPSQGMATALLGRPTDNSINVNVLPLENLDMFVEYKNSTGATYLRTPLVTTEAGVPENIIISGLAPDTGYMYHLGYRPPGATTIQYSPEYSFHTQRSPGSSFVFDVQADSHLDERASEALYRVTLNNELNDKPDFLIDLGDTFMTDKLPVKNKETYLGQYLRQRTFFDTMGHSVPSFLALGNHDGESGYALDGTGENIAVLSSQFRKMYFPNPEPDGFYTGNSANEAFTGQREDYYAWEWGDALFVVLDPYWYTLSKPGGKTDGWGWTLGDVQYQWLQKTLEQSDASYKFVFAHHLVGGRDTQGRGGTEYASLYEWGGKNTDGSWGFDQHRPGWGTPIHQLLVENNVTIFFHGHDHFFACQELDGVTYQEVPQPATMSSPKASPGAEYGYVNGEMLGSPGHLRITVSPELVRVDYVHSSVSGDKSSNLNNGAIAYSYSLSPFRKTTEAIRTER
jgi:hypothetical protein